MNLVYHKHFASKYSANSLLPLINLMNFTNDFYSLTKQHVTYVTDAKYYVTWHDYLFSCVMSQLAPNGSGLSDYWVRPKGGQTLQIAPDPFSNDIPIIRRPRQSVRGRRDISGRGGGGLWQRGIRVAVNANCSILVDTSFGTKTGAANNDKQMDPHIISVDVTNYARECASDHNGTKKYTMCTGYRPSVWGP